MSPNAPAGLTPFNGTASEEEQRRYQAMVGSILYIYRCTRPDITVAVGIASRFAANPGPEHFDLLLRIIRYLSHTKDMKLQINGRKSPNLTAFCDADFAGDRTDRKSTSGYAVFLAGNLISWTSTKQRCTAQSTMDAEFVALNECSREVVYIKGLIEEMLGRSIKAMVFCDNAAAIAISKDSREHSRAKHIDVKYHYIREVLKQNTLEIEHVESSKNTADILTKGLSRDCFHRHRQGLRVGRQVGASENAYSFPLNSDWVFSILGNVPFAPLIWLSVCSLGAD